MADADGVRSFEASPEGVVEYHSTDLWGVLHTNHPLAQSFGALDVNVNSQARLQCLRNRLNGSRRPDLDAVKAALSSRDDPDHPVSRTASPSAQPNQWTGLISFTTGSIISTLRHTLEESEAWISPGPPSVQGYTRLPLQSI